MKPAYHAYEGSKPYIFISYAHKDSDEVLAVVAELMARKYRVWYDEGLEVGDDWPEIIAGRLAGVSHVIVFTSENSAKSPNCVREVNYAVDQRKQFSRVQLDDVVSEGAMGLQLSVAPTVDARTMAAEAICTRLEQMGCISDAFVGDGVEGYTERTREVKKSVNKWMIIAAVFAVLFLAAAGVALGMTGGWFGDAGIQTGSVSYGDGSDAMAAALASRLLEIDGSDVDTSALGELLAGSLTDAELHIAKGTIYGDVEAFRGEGTVIGEITPAEEFAEQLSSIGDMLLAQQVFGTEFAGKAVQVIRLP